jgi:DNA-binding XRE family transcriptional regulator
MAENCNIDSLLENLKKKSKTNNDAISVAQNISAVIRDLIRIRKEKGITQTELANLIGVKQSTIGRIETLQVMPKLDTIIKMANILDVKLAVLKK